MNHSEDFQAENRQLIPHSSLQQHDLLFATAVFLGQVTKRDASGTMNNGSTPSHDPYNVTLRYRAPSTLVAGSNEPQGKSPSGTMAISTSRMLDCTGFINVGSIIIDYNIPSGQQQSYHDHPGQNHGSKFARAYLPNNQDGKGLLKRLKYSFLD